MLKIVEAFYTLIAVYMNVNFICSQFQLSKVLHIVIIFQRNIEIPTFRMEQLAHGPSSWTLYLVILFQCDFIVDMLVDYI